MDLDTFIVLAVCISVFFLIVGVCLQYRINNIKKEKAKLRAQIERQMSENEKRSYDAMNEFEKEVVIEMKKHGMDKPTNI